ncbi:MAG: SAM-dependent methyltransferase [Pseudomonadota bacterium]
MPSALGRKNLLSLAAHLPLQMAFMPLTLGGAAAMGYRQMTMSRQLGVSRTAVEVLNARCAMHLFGQREDRLSLQLAHALPNASPLGLGAALFPLWLKHRIDGSEPLYPRVPPTGQERVVDLIPARTQVLDQMIERLLPATAQFVVLGAGLDVRAAAVAAEAGIPCYELDQPQLQSLKKEALASFDAIPGNLHFIAIDFQRHALGQRLAQCGVDPNKRTLFLWEGVTLYLTEDAVVETLREIAGFAAPGSVLLADIYADRFLRLGRIGPGKLFLSLSGESFRFGLPLHDPARELAAFFQPSGLSLREAVHLGGDTSRGCFAAVVEAQL